MSELSNINHQRIQDLEQQINQLKEEIDAITNVDVGELNSSLEEIQGKIASIQQK